MTEEADEDPEGIAGEMAYVALVHGSGPRVLPVCPAVGASFVALGPPLNLEDPDPASNGAGKNILK